MRSGASTEQLDNITDKLQRVSNREITSMSILPLDVMMAIVAAERDDRSVHGGPEFTCKLLEVNEDQVDQQLTPKLIERLSELNKERVQLIVKGQSHYTTIDFQFGAKGNSFVILDAARHATSLPIYEILSNLKKPNDPTSNLFDTAIIVGDAANRYDKLQTDFITCSAFAAYMAFEASRLPDFHQTCASAGGNDSASQPAWSSLPPSLIRYAQSPKWWAQYRATHQAEAAQVAPPLNADKAAIGNGIVDWAAGMSQKTADFLASKRHQLAEIDPIDVDRRMVDILKSEANIAPIKSQVNNNPSAHDTDSIKTTDDLIARLTSEAYVDNLTACAGLCTTLNESGKLHTLIEDFYTLNETLRHIDHQQKSEILCSTMMDHLPAMINDSNSIPYCVGIVFPYLNSEQRTSVLEHLDQHKLANDVSDVTDFMDVMSNIPASDCAKICEQILSLPDKKGMFKSAQEFANTLNDKQKLGDENCKAVVEGMKASSYRFPNNDSLGDVLTHLQDDRRSLLENELNMASSLKLK